MAALTREDLIDLDRWHSIQFASHEAASSAIERYRRYRAALAARDGERWSRVTDLPAAEDAPALAA